MLGEPIMNIPIEILEYNWQDMYEGETVRLYCSSPTCENKIGKALTLTRLNSGAIYNCYRCGVRGKIGQSSTPKDASRKLKEIRDGRKTANNPDTYVVELPNDFISLLDDSNKIPAKAFGWIYKYELNLEDIYNYNIGYSNMLGRVIIPIYDNNKLIAWQGRYIFNNIVVKKYHTEYNKYNNNNNKLYYKLFNNNILNNKKEYPINNYNTKIHNILSYKQYNTSFKQCIIVEDILSCIKVYNKFNIDSFALLNSTITYNTCADLNLYDYDRVYIWLDWDAKTKALQSSMKLRNSGIDSKTVMTTQDPKAVPYKDMVLIK